MREKLYSQKLAIFFNQDKKNENRSQHLVVPDGVSFEDTDQSFAPPSQRGPDAKGFGKVILVESENEGRAIAQQWAKIYWHKFPGQPFEIWLQPQHLQVQIEWSHQGPLTNNESNYLVRLKKLAISMTKRWQGLSVSFPDEKNIIFDVACGGKYASKVQHLAFKWGQRHIEKIPQLQGGEVMKKDNGSKASDYVFVTNQSFSIEKDLREIGGSNITKEKPKV